jgi:outer membrane protein OmpU
MKKILLGTTAIVAAGMIVSAPAAFAAEKLKLSVGGYMEQWFGYVSQEDGVGQDFSGIDVKSDAEIHFKGSTKLDNGITVGVNVQLEANQNNADQIDESYLIVKGGFGEINLGDENSAMYKMNYAPSEFGISINSGDQTAWLSTVGTGGATGAKISEGGYFRSPFGSTYIEPLGVNDSTKLTYYTPRIEGVQLGLSYSPDSLQDSNSMSNRITGNSDLVMAGLNFNRTFEGTNIRGSLGYGTVLDAANDGDKATAFNAGLGVAAGGFAVGAAYSAFDKSGGKNGYGLNLGGNYTSGPWGVSLSYFHGEKDGTGAGTTLSGQGAQDTFLLSTKYAMGPGITANATLGQATFSSDDAALDNKTNEVSAKYVVVGMRLSF